MPLDTFGSRCSKTRTSASGPNFGYLRNRSNFMACRSELLQDVLWITAKWQSGRPDQLVPKPNPRWEFASSSGRGYRDLGNRQAYFIQLVFFEMCC